MVQFMEHPLKYQIVLSIVIRCSSCIVLHGSTVTTFPQILLRVTRYTGRMRDALLPSAHLLRITDVQWFLVLKNDFPVPIPCAFYSVFIMMVSTDRSDVSKSAHIHKFLLLSNFRIWVRSKFTMYILASH